MCYELELENEDVYVATTFGDFIQLLVRKLQGDNKESECIIDSVSPGPLHVGLALQTSQTLTSVISMTHGEKLSIPESRALKTPPSISQTLPGNSDSLRLPAQLGKCNRGNCCVWDKV